MMRTVLRLLKQIEDSYKSFSKGQKRIANYICENYDKAVNLTAARLGHIVGVSESTVVRFATELGYKGYPQFQDALEEIVKNKLNSIQRITLTAGRVDEKEILKAVLQSLSGQQRKLMRHSLMRLLSRLLRLSIFILLRDAAVKDFQDFLPTI